MKKVFTSSGAHLCSFVKSLLLTAILFSISHTAQATCNTTAAWSYYSLGGDSLRFHSSDTVSGATIKWAWGDGTVTYDSITINHKYATAGTYTVCLYVYYTPGGCADTFCQSVTAGPPCTVTAQWSDYSLGGDSLRFYAYDTNTAAHHIWTWGDGTYTSGTTLTNHHYTSPGTYHVCFNAYIPGTNCSDSLCQTITVSVPCTTTASWSDYSLGGDSVRFYAYDTTSGAYHIWNWGDGTYTSGTTLTNHHYAAPGTYRVCFYAYYTPGGCADSLCQYITVGNTCQAGFSYSIVSGTDSVTFYSTSTSTDSIVSYSWTFGGGSTGSGRYADHNFDTSGQHIVCLTISSAGGCQSSRCDTINIPSTTPCTLNPAWSYTDLGGDSVNFYAADTSTTTHHIWKFGDGTYASSNTYHPSHVYAQPGTYQACLYVYVPGGCEDSLCQTIVVTGSTVCHITADWFDYSLAGDSMRFYTSDTNTAAHHIWNWGDGTITSGTTLTDHVFPAAGTYHVCLYVYIPGTTCSDSMCADVNVGTPPCTATASWSSYSLGGDSMRFYAYDTSSAAHFYWVWGDGSTTTGVRITDHTYTAPGTYHVCLYMYLPGTTCGDSLCQDITIAGGAPCNIRYGWTYTSTGGDSVTFSAEDTVSAAHHIWSFGDGSNSGTSTTHTTHVYAAPGTYQVCFYVYIPGTTCSDSFCQSVTVVASNPCHVTAAWSDYALGGDSLRFYSTDTNTAAHHIWVWGDGSYTSGLTITNHTYAQPGTYHVCYYVYIPGTNCSDSLCDNVTVGSTTSGCNITAAWTSYNVGGDSIRFFAYDTNTAAHIVWTFGDGTYTYATNNPTHVYAQSGTYHVCVYVYLPGNSACSDSSCGTVTIAPAATPPCTITASWVSYGLSGDSVRFYAADTNSAAHHIWTWGDGTYTSGTTATTHAFPGAGTYHVCLYVYVPGTNCSDSLCDNVVVAGNPCHITAQWAAYDLGSDSVRFYSADTNTAAHHVWVWGDGSYTSGPTYTTHVYADTGTYHVCYYVYLPGTNCIDSMCGEVTLSANGHFTLSANFNTNPLGGDTVGFAATDTNGNVYEIWSFGDGTYAFNTTNPTHVYASSGTYVVCYYLFVPGTNLADSVCETISVVLGINSVTDANIRIITQPNPFNQSTLVRTEGLTGTFDFKLYDLVGKLLHYEKGVNGSFTLQRGNLSAGMYLFEVIQNGKVIGTGKIVAE